jgi:hypothetical protein
MPGQFTNSPNLIGKSYKEVADHPYDEPIAQDGDRFVYKGIRKVLLVQDGKVIDFYDWEKFGNKYRYVQKKAQEAWGIKWPI